MTTKTFLRGRETYRLDGVPYYKDNDEPTIGNPRTCGHCNLPDREDGIDACLGKLPGVMNACCGHGGKADGSYIQFDNGTIVRDFKLCDL